jgi:hypothetical protein
MAVDPSQFSNMYLLDFDGTNFTLIDPDNDGGNGLTPAEQNVSVKDDLRDGETDRHDKIGDIANDQFDVTNAGGLNGTYAFVSLGLTGDSDAGFIAQNTTTGDYYYFTNDQIAASQIGTTLSEQGGVLAVCFMPGTAIATPAGERPVETLRIGDHVLSSDGRAVAVRWIGQQTVAPRFADPLRLPIRVKAGALGENVPARDLLVSPDHALFVDGVLIHAGALVNGTSVVRETDVPVIFTYYHVETEDHSLIMAENAPAETFVDNIDRGRFDNFAEYAALYPDGHAIVELPYPRAKAHRQVPSSVRARLAERAVSFGRNIIAAA